MGVFFLLNTGQLPFIRWSGHSHLVGHVSAFRYGSGYMDIGAKKEVLLKDRVKGTHCFNSSNLFKVATAPESVTKTHTSLFEEIL